MEEPTKIIVTFVQMLAIEPPVLSAQDVGDLPQLKEKLNTLLPDRIEEASQEIRQWCDLHPHTVEVFAALTAKKLNPSILTHEKQPRVPDFDIESTKGAVFIKPQLDTIGANPRKRPILEYTQNLINQKIMESLR